MDTPKVISADSRTASEAVPSLNGSGRVQGAPACHVCGKPATCIGAYEDPDAAPQPACDDCCGHGNEDGYCDPIVADEVREAWEADNHARAREFGGE